MGVNPIKHMKNTTLSAKGFESTYALLVRSEEKERNLFEGTVYLVLVLSAVFSIWQAAHLRAVEPASRLSNSTSQTATTQRA